MKKLLIASLAVTLSACSTVKTDYVPTPRIPLTGELAREPATCPALADNTGWKEVSQLFVCWKQAAGMNGEHVKALQWLWEK